VTERHEAIGLETWLFSEQGRRLKFAAFMLAVLPAFPVFAGDAFTAPGQNAHAQSAGRNSDPHAFAVNIFRNPRQSWPGYGVYLGDGLVLSAAHVVGRSMLGNPSVAIAGRTLEAKVVKEGEFETVDLTLLRIDARELPPSLGLRLMPICRTPPRAGQPVIVVTPQAVSTSHILSPKALPADLQGRHFDTLIADVETTGNSGSGVFDPTSACLMGIISRKIQIATTPRRDPGAKPKMIDIAKYFVPARQILQFIKPD
jgi:hypothetical protein